MIHHIVLEKLCLCATKHQTEQIRSYNTKEEAFLEANDWAENLSDSFCGKHGFKVVEVDDNFVISVEIGGFDEPCEI